jgi:beta-fructofuranosidase
LDGKIAGRSLEIIADIDLGSASAVTLKLRASANGARAVAIRYEPATRTLSAAGRAPVVLPPAAGGDLKLHVFLDRGALDVYAANGAVTLCSFVPGLQPGDERGQIVAEGGTARIRQLGAYTMRPAMFDLGPFGSAVARK